MQWRCWDMNRQSSMTKIYNCGWTRIMINLSMFLNTATAWQSGDYRLIPSTIIINVDTTTTNAIKGQLADQIIYDDRQIISETLLITGSCFLWRSNWWWCRPVFRQYFSSSSEKLMRKSNIDGLYHCQQSRSVKAEDYRKFTDNVDIEEASEPVPDYEGRYASNIDAG